MKCDLLELLKSYKIDEAYCLESDEIPFYAIISPEASSVMSALEELSDLEADVVVLSPEEKGSLYSSESEIASTVLNVIERGSRLI